MKVESRHGLLVSGYEPLAAENLVQMSGLAGRVRLVTESGSAPVDVAVVADVGVEARSVVDRVLAQPAGNKARFLVLAAAGQGELFQDLVNADRLLFLTHSPPDLEAVAALLRVAFETSEVSASGDRKKVAGDQWAAGLRRLAACTDLSEAVRVVGHDAVAHTAAERGTCWLLSEDGHSLESPRPGAALDVSTAAGLTSFVALTGNAVRIEAASTDPRYDPDVDTPEDGGHDRLLVVPLTVGRRRLGALAVTRGSSEPPFGDDQHRRLEHYGRRAAPLLAGLVDEARSARAGVGTGVFRRAALDHHSRGAEREGRPLEMTPVWLERTYHLLLALLAVAAAFVLLGRHSEYAAGPAVVRVDQGLDVTSPIAGTAVGVEVAVGDLVSEGRLLARFYDQREAAELRRLRSELDSRLAELLRDPSDLTASRGVAGLRAQVELAEARLEERSLRAPKAGRVRDLRLRPGQAVQPGDVVLSLAGAAGEREVEVLALLPGHARPQLAPGTSLRLELAGYRYAYQQLVIERVGNEVLGPAEAGRSLPAGVADALRPVEPVVFVHARLSSDQFEVAGRDYAYHDGMPGRVEAKIRSERLIFTFLPALRALFSGAETGRE